jgi:uncharacterized membrane protein
MNMAHLHLLVNHFPIIWTIFGLGFYLVALIGKRDDLKRAGLGVFFLTALISIPAYQTGYAAEAAIKHRRGISEALIVAHQDAALLAFIFIELTGALAWLGLWQYRRILRQTTWNVSAVLLLSMVTVGLMARTGNLGGEIRHPEIRSAAEATDTEAAAGFRIAWMTSTAVAGYVNRIPWVWPASETFHFIGLSLLFGILLLVNLRMLGMAKLLSFVDLHRLLPWGLLGFGLNLITGMLFFIGTPEQYTANVAFFWKMAFLMLAGINVLYLTVFDEAWNLGPADNAPLRAKVFAALAIFLWVGVIFFGRMLPFLGNSF